MNELKVLHVLNSTSGGSAMSTFQLIEALREYNVESSLICFLNGTPELRQEISELVAGRVVFRKLHWMNKRIRARGWNRPFVEALDWKDTWGGYRYLKSFQEFARQQGTQLVHTSTILNTEGALVSAKLGLPHVFHGRELIGPGNPYRFYRFGAWRKWIQNHSQAIITNSGVTHQLYQSFFPSDHLRFIPNGIPLDGFTSKSHVPKETLVVGMVGNLTSRWKDHPRFVAIALECLRAGLPFEFRMYGSLPKREDEYVASMKASIAAAGFEDKVRFMGFVSEPREFIPELDIMLHTAPHESFGRIFIEAMACEVPVVAVNKGGALDLIRPEENGYLFETDEEAIASLRKLTDANLRASLGSGGRAIVASEYDMRVIAGRVRALYDELV